MSEIVTSLFVYGTLMPEGGNYWQIQDHVLVARPGTLDGVLVDLGAFPALIPGHGIVRGVLLNVDRAALKITDRIEGYSPDRDHCLYLRKEVTVVTESGENVPAWTYVFADPDSIADHPRLIVGRNDGKPVGAWSRG